MFSSLHLFPSHRPVRIERTGGGWREVAKRGGFVEIHEKHEKYVPPLFICSGFCERTDIRGASDVIVLEVHYVTGRRACFEHSRGAI